jgi:hypothetical protein
MIRSALLAAICLTSFQGTEEPVRPREDWIQDDLRRIELFKSTVQAEDLDVESLVAKFGSIGEHDDADAGFGVRRVHMHLYGGYTTIWIDLLGDRRTDDGKSRVVELRARQRGPAETWPAIEARYAAAWGDLAKPIEHGFEFTTTSACGHSRNGPPRRWVDPCPSSCRRICRRLSPCSPRPWTTS